MKSYLKYIVTVLFTVFGYVASFAQAAADKPEMADAFKKDGKIYVVIAVLSIVFVGIIVYLIMIDRKVSKLEKQQAEKN